MVIDTSALVAILFDEPDRPGLARAIEADPVRLVSAATVLEASMVVEARRGDSATHSPRTDLEAVTLPALPG